MCAVFLYTFVDDPADRTLFAVYSGEFAPAAQTWDGVTNLIVRFESDYSVELGGFEFEWFSLVRFCVGIVCGGR